MPDGGALVGIDRGQARRHCEARRRDGAFEAHPRLWPLPKGAAPERKSFGCPPAWTKREGDQQTEHDVT